MDSVRNLGGGSRLRLMAAAAAIVALAAARRRPMRWLRTRTRSPRRRCSSASSPTPTPASAQLSSARARATRCARRLGAAQPARASKRTSLAYFGQLSDFQLADEESPARVEFARSGRPAGRCRLAPLGGAGAADRRRDGAPDQCLRRPPARSRTATAREPTWTSRSTPATRPTTSSSTRRAGCGRSSRAERSTRTAASTRRRPANPPARRSAVPIVDGDDPANYTGVQDYDDYVEGPDPYFYDPEPPAGPCTSRLPEYTGADGRAPRSRSRPTGLDVPSYVAFGNHDGAGAGQPAGQLAASSRSPPAASSRSPAPRPAAPAIADALAELSPPAT